MTINEKKVYYCDFCKKHGLSSYWMREHEKHCTLNPDRRCGMPWCGASPSVNLISETFFHIMRNMTSEGSFPGHEHCAIDSDYIRGLLDETECAACTLSVLRIASAPVRDADHTIGWDWDYKKEALSQLSDYQRENTYY
jgi:hypothetical protein